MIAPTGPGMKPLRLGPKWRWPKTARGVVADAFRRLLILGQPQPEITHRRRYGAALRILFSWDAAKSSRSRAKRSWCALKLATCCRISSRSELFRFTGGIRFGSTTARGMGGWTRTRFVNAIVSWTSALRSACQLVMLILPPHNLPD
jgi:hypothetical protein